MKGKRTFIKKAYMWCKVKELRTHGMNKVQIAREVGIHRDTVSRYLKMSEEEFYAWIEKEKNQPKKLNRYYEWVKKLLEQHDYLSAAQVEDRLKENFGDLPHVHSKTVYNFVQSIRKKYCIRKYGEKEPRKYEKLPEPAYGHQAQADFGEYMMQTKEGMRKKVHFMCMVLCRSRYKYVHFQTRPFTTEMTIRAHEKALDYFEGEPNEILYDQDKVLLADENLGDIVLTKEFTSYVREKNFKTAFCRKSDPETKGKIENVVKYIKYNFLRGRTFMSEEELNKSALLWLQRTANSKEHAGIKKIPMEEWQIEKQHLLPLSKQVIKQEYEKPSRYRVRKDNTISYKSNFYTLPLGTYKDADTWLLLKEEQDQIHLYTEEGTWLATHPICYERGVTVRNTNHCRDKSQSIDKLKQEVMKLIPGKEKSAWFIEKIQKDKPRYVRDNLLLLKKHLPELSPEVILFSLEFCIENDVYNARKFIEIAKHYLNQNKRHYGNKAIIPDLKTKHHTDRFNIVPQVSKLSTYEAIM